MRVRIVAVPLALVCGAGIATTSALAGPTDLVSTVSSALPASTSVCTQAVSVSGVYDQTAASAGHAGQHWVVPGDTVAITGAHFLQAGCSVTVTVGDAPAIAVAPGAVAPGGSSLTFAVPALSAASPTNTKGLNGPVTVQLHDPSGNVASSNSTYHVLEQMTASLQQTQPAEGTAISFSGLGFNTGGDPVATSAVFTGCPGPGVVSQPATVQSDTQLASSGPTTYCDGAVQVSRTDPHYDSAPNAADDVPITVSAPAGSADVAGVVASVSPTTVSPGGLIDVRGSGFGPSGAVKLAGITASNAWSDSEILVQAPAAPSGRLLLTRSTGDRASFSAGSITMVAPAPNSTGTPGGTAGGSGGNNGLTPTALGGFSTSGGFTAFPQAFTLHYTGVPAAKSGVHQQLAAQQNADQLTIASASSQGTVGSDVGVTVTFLISGKPVVGAPVALSLVSAPGSDAKVSPPDGRTDSDGQFHTQLKLSKLAGDHLVLARSGTYSDEVHVLAETKSTGAAINTPFGAINVSGNPLVVWLSIACVAAILLGVLVNLNVMRRFVWANSGGRALGWWSRRRHRPRVHTA